MIVAEYDLPELEEKQKVANAEKSQARFVYVISPYSGNLRLILLQLQKIQLYRCINEVNRKQSEEVSAPTSYRVDDKGVILNNFDSVPHTPCSRQSYVRI
jgi:hypothetical protein